VGVTTLDVCLIIGLTFISGLLMGAFGLSRPETICKSCLRRVGKNGGSTH
jgi:hypothetical protein